MDSIIYYIIILIPLIIVFLFNQKKKQLINLINKANLEFHLGNFPKALELYKQAIKQDKKNPELYHSYGEVQNAMRNHEDAIISFSKAIALKPDHDVSYILRALAYTQLKEYRKALSDCNHVISANASDPDSIPCGVYIVRGSICIDMRKFKQALSEFKLALRPNPNSFVVNTCLAEVYCYLGQYEKALDYVNKTLELTPVCDIIYLWRGWANYGLSNFDIALKDCNDYIEKDPENAKAFEVRGLIYKALKDFDNALKDLKEAERLYQKHQLQGFDEEVQQHIEDIIRQKLGLSH